MPLQGAKLTIGGDTFEFKYGSESNPGSMTDTVRTGFLVGGRGSTAISLARDFLDDFKLNNSQADANRAGFFLDGGGGVRTWQFDVFVPEDDVDYEWGGHAGDDPITMKDVFMHAAETVRVDSTHSARLETGEYSSGGMFSPQNVVLEQPQLSVSTSDPYALTGSVTCLKAADASAVIDGLSQLG